MGRPKELTGWRNADRLPLLSSRIRRTKPRRFVEWKALRRWGRLPPWEVEPAGYLLRLAREEAGLTQGDLAKRLECTQQAVAQAERWEANPTVEFLRHWAEQCGYSIELRVTPSESAGSGIKQEDIAR